MRVGVVVGEPPAQVAVQGHRVEQGLQRVVRGRPSRPAAPRAGSATTSASRPGAPACWSCSRRGRSGRPGGGTPGRGSRSGSPAGPRRGPGRAGAGRSAPPGRPPARCSSSRSATAPTCRLAVGRVAADQRDLEGQLVEPVARGRCRAALSRRPSARGGTRSRRTGPTTTASVSPRSTLRQATSVGQRGCHLGRQVRARRSRVCSNTPWITVPTRHRRACRPRAAATASSPAGPRRRRRRRPPARPRRTSAGARARCRPRAGRAGRR